MDTKLRMIQDWTFEKDDKLEYVAYAQKLQAYLNVDHHFANGSLVISLEAPFGSGKSAFLSMWKNLINAEKQKNNQAPLGIIVNAWEDDYCNEPLLAIAFALIKAIESTGNKNSPGTIERFKNAFRTLAMYSYFSANGVVNALTGFNPHEVGEQTKQQLKTETETLKPDFYRMFEHRKAAIQDLRTSLTSSFGGSSVNAIVMVDELDRCRPDYAISFLETIKHIFDLSGIVFVLAIDREHVANSAKSLFGNELDTSEYLRKFISRSFEFPKPKSSAMSSFFRSCAQRFISLPEIRTSAIQHGVGLEKAEEVCLSFKLTLRQIEEFFRILGHYFSVERQSVRLDDLTSLASFFLCALKIKASKIYRAIGDESLSTFTLLEFLHSLMPAEDVMFWGAMFFSGKKFDADSGENFGQIWTRTGIETGLAQRAERTSMEFANKWPHFIHSPINRLYDRIESAMTIISG